MKYFFKRGHWNAFAKHGSVKEHGKFEEDPKVWCGWNPTIAHGGKSREERGEAVLSGEVGMARCEKKGAPDPSWSFRKPHSPTCTNVLCLPHDHIIKIFWGRKSGNTVDKLPRWFGYGWCGQEPPSKRFGELRIWGMSPRQWRQDNLKNREMTELDLFLKDAEYGLEWRKCGDRATWGCWNSNNKDNNSLYLLMSQALF